MYAQGRTASRRSVNIWPGFVDGLASLLLVVMFVLMVFMVAQFFLTTALTGRDQALEQLNREVSELAELLALERAANADLRLNVAQLSSELQSSIAERETLGSQLSALLDERIALENQLSDSEAQRDSLTAQIAALLEEQESLERLLAEAEAVTEKTREELEEAYATIEADKEKIEAQLAELAILKSLNEDMVTQLSSMEEALGAQEESAEALRARVEELEIELAARLQERDTLAAQLLERESQLSELAASAEEIERNAERLAAAEAERDSLAEQLGLSQEERDRLTERLMASQEEREALAEQLALSEEERNKLVQQLTLTEEERDRLAEENELSARQLLQAQQDAKRQDTLAVALKARSDEAEQEITRLTKLSEEAQAKVTLLNRQIAALRQQLSRLAVALEAAEALNTEKDVRIADLGRRLNVALATKVQELARYRSEFFGRLREVLGQRDDIRVVGDRFVFQSELLFASGSAQIGSAGQIQLSRLAQTLREVADRFPPEIDWILRVDGHTDSQPISTSSFRSNWELSTARALSVVRFLITQGIASERLAATGFGEFQPIDDGDDEGAFSRNRRIEMRLDQR